MIKSKSHLKKVSFRHLPKVYAALSTAPKINPWKPIVMKNVMTPEDRQFPIFATVSRTAPIRRIRRLPNLLMKEGTDH